ncbi:hypothetical protein CAOG_04346 [Capsaspora owczarzaki ATCC 30864]|uniref:Uncharacterized protein n=1 Tax=Capsaspora owczarzaki (strain ATCC 30864) TaxID=595528 RepID=A0A0D2UEP4_CAPO3|nr:hypothetical protein CAOG_04346 [Capsaspora owczarzaki ATCC 30864]KJE93581.1 hypothetical protein CAOG_004346 [Capsaspora owczarzaki ATCC 30864]|eukprot:XP_004348174.1 hypothetical protein CAOG_04346 [Capsaspora owczarzaki ATCC 30864]
MGAPAAGSSRRCCVCTRKRLAIWMGALGALLLAVGIAIDPAVNWLVKMEVKDSVMLTSTSSALYDQWQNPSIPIYMTFFMFNVENPEEVFDHGSPPFVREMGPYVYNELRIKVNVTWNANQTVLTYRQHQTYIFNQEMSGTNTEDDQITTINFGLCGLVGLLYTKGLAVKMAIDGLLQAFPKEKYFMTRPVREILWGYKDPLMSALHLVDNTIDPIIALQQNDSAPDWQFDSKILTGKEDINQVVRYIQWDGFTELPYWGSKYANMINGTDASQFAPDVQDDFIAAVFVDSIYRSAYLLYHSDVSVEGIRLKRFTIDPMLLANSTVNPDNAAFYDFGPSGVLNMSTAAGAPVFASKPHFLDGDEIYRTNVLGLHPVREWHDTNLDIEPITGALMQAAKRLQLNMEIRNDPYIFRTGKTPYAMLPIFYGNESVCITADLAGQFKDQVYTPLIASTAVHWSGIALGSIMLLVCIVLVALLVRERRSGLDLSAYNVNQGEDSALLGKGQTWE